MMQTVFQVLILAVLLLAVPFLAGGLFVPAGEEGVKPLFRWISGQMLLWAGFQVICVPFVLREADFNMVAVLYGGYMGVLLILALAVFAVRMRKKRLAERSVKPCVKPEREEAVLWLIFLLLFLFQLVQAVRLTYGDGDDAYYVSIATIAESSGAMYTREPYGGWFMPLDIRHGLAPFPVWIAFLARVSGMPVAMTAHLAVSVTLIAMGYGVLALIGGQLVKSREQLPVFMILAGLLVLFGGYSIYTSENFMLARSRQGKAALASLVIPFIVFLLLYLFRQADEGKAVCRRYYLLLAAAVASGCLCSTMGALLCCMLIGVAGIAGFFLYRDGKRLLLLFLSCLPGMGYAALYLLLTR